jgi:hypothetical protein
MQQILIRQIFMLVLRFIGGQWIILIPLAYQTLSSLVKIAHGKDGSEVAVTSLLKCLLHTYYECECEIKWNLIPMYASDFFYFLLKGT